MTDAEWIEANLNPSNARGKGLKTPDLPPPEVQERFTGSSGRPNLEQAFEFYKFVLPRLPSPAGRYRVVDFGGGWGRILRFFLREFPAEKLLLTDTMGEATRIARELNPPFEVVHHDPIPPLPIEPGATADAVIAYSVFSHLNEPTASAWLSHFASLLVPGGRVIATTRGRRHINSIRRSRSRLKPWSRIKRLLRNDPSGHESELVARLPEPDLIERRFAAGGFQFYPTGGGDELAESFYGEAWIGEAWLREHAGRLGFAEVEYVPEFGSVNQCVFVLTTSP